MIRPGELAGRLRERIAIHRRGTARDAIGGAADEWIEIDQAWAAIEPTGAGPLVEGEAMRARPRWRVTVRSEADVAVDDRMIWRGAPIRVRGRMADPRWPDRIFIEGEEEA